MCGHRLSRAALGDLHAARSGPPGCADGTATLGGPSWSLGAPIPELAVASHDPAGPVAAIAGMPDAVTDVKPYGQRDGGKETRLELLARPEPRLDPTVAAARRIELPGLPVITVGPPRTD
jgi:hypothetical protein